MEHISFVEPNLHTELWISWASLLRSYAVLHNSHVTQPLPIV